MNVLFYCNEYPPYPHGGIGTFTKEVAERLAKLGVNVYVYGAYNGESKTEIINGVTFIVDKKPSNNIEKIFLRIKIYFRLKGIIKKYSINILEVQDAGGLLAFYPKLKTNIVIRLHGSKTTVSKLCGEKPNLSYYIFKFLEKSHLQKTKNIIAVSEFTAKYTKKVFKLNFKDNIHYNGIKNLDIEPIINNKEQDIITYSFIGSLYERKGIFDLISAWIKFTKKRSNVQLIVFGKNINSNLEKIKKQLADNNIYNVEFKGHCTKNEMFTAMRLIDFVFIPSHVENFSLVPLEAMINKKVVYYTNQTSAAELIKDGENGFLINGKDDIYNKLECSYHLTKDEYNKIAMKGYKTVVENFVTEVTLSKDIDFYKRIITNGD
ncbi:TPA: glycosyltransferase family 4 protein [Photobacterium damselae]